MTIDTHEITVQVRADLAEDEELAFLPDLPEGTEYRHLQSEGYYARTTHPAANVVVIARKPPPLTVTISADLAYRLCTDAFYTQVHTTAKERDNVRDLVHAARAAEQAK